ncbi:hypothetical protein ACFSKM_04075 [Ancylobacter dichloromethanicus]
MKRTIIAATAAALLAGVTFGVAAPKSGMGEHARPSPAQMAEFAGAMSDARIAALKAGLRLSAEQEKNCGRRWRPPCSRRPRSGWTGAPSAGPSRRTGPTASVPT